MNAELNYPWQQGVVEAFLAPPHELPAKVSIAERAISARLNESHELDFPEEMALEDALRMLKVLISETKAQLAEDQRAEYRDQRAAIA